MAEAVKKNPELSTEKDEKAGKEKSGLKRAREGDEKDQEGKKPRLEENDEAEDKELSRVEKERRKGSKDRRAKTEKKGTIKEAVGLERKPGKGEKKSSKKDRRKSNGERGNTPAMKVTLEDADAHSDDAGGFRLL